jgi:hypothetical protein
MIHIEGKCRHLLEFMAPKKLIGLIYLCLTESYSEVRAGKPLFQNSSFPTGLNQRDALSPLLLNFALEYVIT